MQVRDAVTADMEQVATIYAHYVETSVATFEEDPPPPGYWQKRLADLTGRELPFLVAESSGTIRGYAYASPWRPRPGYRYTVEDSVYVAPGQAGRGIGTALLKALLPACAQSGARQVIAVIADSGSDASAALHRKFGFTDVGRLTGVGYKHGRWIDTALLQRDLT